MGLPVSWDNIILTYTHTTYVQLSEKEDHFAVFQKYQPYLVCGNGNHFFFLIIPVPLHWFLKENGFNSFNLGRS